MKIPLDRSAQAGLFPAEGALKRTMPEAIKTELTDLLSQLLLSVAKAPERPMETENKKEEADE